MILIGTFKSTTNIFCTSIRSSPKTPWPIEPDQPGYDQHLNPILSAAFVDPWQHTPADIHPPTQGDLTEELPQNGPLVTLTATLEERFVNTLISRQDEPEYVPLTTNLGLKYRRRMLYFPMDIGELTLDGLVDTGALSSAILKLIYVKSVYYPLSQLQKRAQLQTSK